MSGDDNDDESETFTKNEMIASTKQISNVKLIFTQVQCKVFRKSVKNGGATLTA